MARWEPNARERLQEAAWELFDEQGYDRTTVGDIAARAGLTERTFFRHFSDKREVLFARAEEIEEGIASLVVSAPKDVAPLDAVAAAFLGASAGFQGRTALRALRARHALILEHPELRERELSKQASLSRALAGALRARGISEPAARLAAEAGLAAFHVAYDTWLRQKKPQDFAVPLRAAMAALRAVVGAGASRGARRARGARTS
jgi:AcrR family transcriptional regulator